VARSRFRSDRREKCRKRCHGIGGGPGNWGRGFISATDPGSVTILSEDARRDRQVPVGEDPNAIFYDGNTKRVFTIDRGCKRRQRDRPQSPAKSWATEKVWRQDGARGLRRRRSHFPEHAIP